LQFANVPQTAALPELAVCSSKPLLQECVASTAPVDAYEKSTLSNETIPFITAAIESHFAAAHVGASTGLHALMAQACPDAPTIAYPSLQV